MPTNLRKVAQMVETLLLMSKPGRREAKLRRKSFSLFARRMYRRLRFEIFSCSNFEGFWREVMKGCIKLGNTQLNHLGCGIPILGATEEAIQSYRMHQKQPEKQSDNTIIIRPKFFSWSRLSGSLLNQ